MIRTLYRRHDGQIDTDIRPEQFTGALQDAGGLLWVDLADEPPEVCESILHDIFGFHPLAVDDALRETHVPKLDDWGSYLYLDLHGVVFDKQGDPAHAQWTSSWARLPRHIIHIPLQPSAGLHRLPAGRRCWPRPGRTAG
jgi:Mg2+ and Co2+ transporter CorA